VARANTSVGVTSIHVPSGSTAALLLPDRPPPPRARRVAREDPE
jgi:hypothetical protein